MRLCSSVPTVHEEGLQCQLDMASYNNTDNTTCINWNQYYTNCSAGQVNPFKGAINFDNIGYAWIAIFQVVSVVETVESCCCFSDLKTCFRLNYPSQIFMYINRFLLRTSHSVQYSGQHLMLYKWHYEVGF